MDATSLLLGVFCALLVVEQFADIPFAYGDVVKSREPWKTWKNSSLNYKQPDNPNFQIEYLLERNYGSFPEKPWNPVDNGHKKKQYPRSSNRYRQEIGPRKRKNHKTANDYTQRLRRTSQLDQPTLRPVGNFNAREDAEKLRIDLRTKHINEDELIKIMTTRTNDQRQEIVKFYPNLKTDLSWKLSFGFRELMKALATPIHEFHAEQLNEAFRFSSKLDEDLVIELLCTLNNRNLIKLQQAYKSLHRKDISDELRGFSRNPLANLLITYTEGKRDEKRDVDSSLATHDAQQLQNAGKLRIEEGSPFRKILLTRSYPQLKQTFSEYKRITGTNMKDAIRRDFSGSIQKGLVNIVKTISNRPQYFAEILNAGIKNFSKRDATLIRVILLRSEIDMGDIKSSYHTLYKLELSTSIPTNTGSLKKALISLITG